MWDSTAKQIVNLIDDEKTIVYCSYAIECQDLASALKLRNARAYVYTGKYQIYFLNDQLFNNCFLKY